MNISNSKLDNFQKQQRKEMLRMLAANDGTIIAFPDRGITLAIVPLFIGAKFSHLSISHCAATEKKFRRKVGQFHALSNLENGEFIAVSTPRDASVFLSEFAEFFTNATSNHAGFDRDGFDRDGFDRDGFDRDGFDRDDFDRDGLDCDGFNRDGLDCEGFDRDGFDRDGFDCDGFDCDGFDCDGFDCDGFDRDGFDCDGFDRDDFDRDDFDRDGFDCDGFNRDGLDCEGFARKY